MGHIHVNKIQAYRRGVHDIDERRMRPQSGLAPTMVDWGTLLRNTFRGLKEPKAVEWCVGGGDARADSEVFLELDSDEEPRGGEASWLRRADVDEQGFLVGWMERAGALRAAFSFDDEGYLCHRQGGRLEQDWLGHLDPAVQIVARARLLGARSHTFT